MRSNYYFIIQYGQAVSGYFFCAYDIWDKYGYQVVDQSSIFGTDDPGFWDSLKSCNWNSNAFKMASVGIQPWAKKLMIEIVNDSSISTTQPSISGRIIAEFLVSNVFIQSNIVCINDDNQETVAVAWSEQLTDGSDYGHR